MKNSSLPVLIILLFSLFFVACDSQNGLKYGEFKDIETIELVSNPTTGYDWSYFLDKKNIVQEVSNKYVPDNKPDDKTISDSAVDSIICGSGGKRIWEFKGLNPGTTKIKFEYKRAWENDNPKETIEFILEVNKQNKIRLIK